MRSDEDGDRVYRTNPLHFRGLVSYTYSISKVDLLKGS